MSQVGLATAQKPEPVRPESKIKLEQTTQVIAWDLPYQKPEIVIGESEHDLEVKREEEKKRLRATRRQASPSYTTGNYKIIGYTNEQCISYAKRMSGISRSLGYAGYTPSQGNEPVIGSIALWSSVGHAGVVVAINGNMITVDHSNWLKGFVIEQTLPIDIFRGFVYS